ncbi:loricrin isoform X2 [Senna tora]|uniref:Loricrin isoform X2 n=1 Tax=Senna tora TaxID=362788 RepID=A0A834SQ03_9FABA|nr:loricrin isoform X2 [Senna tora]
MSASNDEISTVGSFRHGCHGDDDGKKKQQHSCYGLRKDMGKAKQVVMHRFAKAKKKLHNCSSKRVLRLSSSVNSTTTSGKTIRGPAGCWGKGSYVCFTRPQVLESFNGSPISDPNDPNLTTFIEKNDFYSKECNPHLD